MKRVSLLLRFVLAVSVVLLLSTGLFADQNQPNGSTSAATKTSVKAKSSTSQAKATSQSSMRGAPSGNRHVQSSLVGKSVPAPNAADEAKSYRLVPAVPVQPSSFDGDVRDLPQIPAVEGPELELFEPTPSTSKMAQSAMTHSPALSLAPTAQAPAPIMNFDGMSYLDNYCNGGQCGAGHPPDTTGAVGLNHYIEAINESFAIYDKATGTRLAAFTENSLWMGQGIGTPCNVNNFGDPIVVYDQTADRWILTQFAFALNGSGNPIAPYYQCMAVSKSGDPVSGGWWYYALRIDQSPVPTNTLNDYPKFGNWNDGCLYMSANGFLNASTYRGQIVASFSKNDMYNGLPLNFALAYLTGSANFSLNPVTMLGKGSNLPSPTTPAYLVGESQSVFAFNVRTITAGSCTGGGSISAATVVSQTSYTVPGQNIVPQPPPATSSNLLDSLGDRMMQWNQYRKVGSAESIWVSHTTRNSNSSNTSPQWAQINVTGGTIATTPIQQQIFRPDTTVYRWMSSIAADNGGNVALGYSTSDATATFPSVVYSGRLASDPVNTMPQGETTIVAGQGSGVFNCGGAVCHRWGDYSSMTVDPTDDCTFWYTNMYYNSQANGSLGNHQTRIASFKYPSCTSILPVAAILKSHSGNFTQGQVGATYSITVTNNGPGFMFGTTTVTDTLPSPYLVATAIGGSGWSCTLGTLTCTRADSLAQGSSYPAITVTVNVASNAPAQVTNSATVSGGGTGSPVTGNDPTTIDPATTVCGTVQLTTTASLVKLNDGSYEATVKVVNNGTGTAQNVKLTAATLGIPSTTTTLPLTIGNLVPGGGFAYVTVDFPASAGTSGSSVAEKYTGTYTACPTSGSWGASIRATLP